ncbi:hypothetical protein HG536_0G04180 [Torulaspora globosa]|uniref:Uncharacterized protein n=1 Tax=Torulaspora globosa TaxID=48254 RepID=A0A7G3ZM20_9SACH|nr:uncharacterized protein HG536_0G04180 [Torulaspora globosa]QLL34556.1 hypothetical protein HG536_0G04180 [Torulaspora globosa]
MKLSIVAAVMAACSTVLSSPVYEKFRHGPLNVTTNGTTVWNRSNHSNVSGGAAGAIGTKLKVFITGGSVPLSNTSQFPNVEWQTLFNASSALNITQLYNVASSVNQTLQDDTFSGVVIVANKPSIEALGFFSAVVFDTNKTVVVTEDPASGIPVAKDFGSQFRGALTVDKKSGLIYSGVFAPAERGAAGVPVGLLHETQVNWFMEPSLPLLIDTTSPIRVTYSNFTTTNVSNNSPVVPIIFDGNFSQSIVNRLAGSINGLVVAVPDFVSNSSTSTLSSTQLPVVFAGVSSGIPFVAGDDVPSDAIAAGYLSPIKSQVLVSIAAANNVSSPASVDQLFP